MLSDVLVQAGNSQVARMAAGLQLKNHLTSKDMALRQKYQQQWLHLPEDIQLYVKKNVSLEVKYCIYKNRTYIIC